MQAVHRAVQAVKANKSTRVLPVFCFDPRQAQRNVLGRPPHARLLGSPKLGAHRARFQMESANALKAALQGIGSDLAIYYDTPETVLPGAGSGGSSALCQQHAQPLAVSTSSSQGC